MLRMLCTGLLLAQIAACNSVGYVSSGKYSRPVSVREMGHSTYQISVKGSVFSNAENIRLVWNELADHKNSLKVIDDFLSDPNA